MPRPFLRAVLGLCLISCIAAVRADDSPDSTQTRLRDALRSANLALAAAQNERDSLQAAAAENDRTAKAAAARADALVKQGIADRAASDKATAALQARLDTQTAEVARLTGALDQAKAAGDQAAQAAKTEQTERARIEAMVLALRRQANDYETKNLALFKIANEVLTRYENFSLGNALAAKEPFAGATRTKLENLVQDYEDKILNQRITP